MQVTLHAYVLIGHVVHGHEDFQVARGTVQQLDEADETSGGAEKQKATRGTNNRGIQATDASKCLFLEHGD